MLAGLGERELQELMAEMIDTDGDGKLDKDEFLEFIRLSLVADLPDSKVQELRQHFFFLRTSLMSFPVRSRRGSTTLRFLRGGLSNGARHPPGE